MRPVELSDDHTPTRPVVNHAIEAASALYGKPDYVCCLYATAPFLRADDLLHGFGGGYFQPILGSRSRPAGKLPDMVLEENMTIVVQPNVVTRDESAGVQLGNLFRITASGAECLHRLPLEYSVKI